MSFHLNVSTKRLLRGEIWCFQYNLETKRESVQQKIKGSARLKIVGIKTTLICFSSHKNIVHFECIKQEETENQCYRLDVLTRLCAAVDKK